LTEQEGQGTAPRQEPNGPGMDGADQDPVDSTKDQMQEDRETAVAVAEAAPSEARDTETEMTAESDAATPAETKPAAATTAEPEAPAPAEMTAEAAMTTEPEAPAPAEMTAEPATTTEPVAAAATEPATAEPATTTETDAAAAAEPTAEPKAESAAEPAAEPNAEPVTAAAVDDDRPEPTTMDELLAGPDAEIRSFKHGDVVEGAVVRIDKDEILVDIGAKSEGVVSNRELAGRHAEAPPALKLGDTVLVYVMQPESDEGHAILSLRRAGLERKWRSMQEQFESGVIIEAPVIDHNKGGLIVDCGIRGFIPISQIVDFPRRPQNDQPRDAAQEIAEKLQPFVGRRLRLKILEVNRKANRLILSEKVALYEERREKRDELFSSLQVGQKVTGTVRSIAPFGVFVDLGGIDGLVHKSELSWNKVNNPEAGYKVGDEVEAEVIDINHERGRISLSIRRLQPDPWHSTVADYKVGDVIEGTVTKLVNFGAFVRVRDGLEGLIHISELSQARVTHPSDVVREGQSLKLKIISLDSERHRLGLSLKQAEEAPAPVERTERPDRERRPRAQREYSPADTVQESDGGIDNTLAAAFAQVREQMAATEEAQRAAGGPADEGSVPGEQPAQEDSAPTDTAAVGETADTAAVAETMTPAETLEPAETTGAEESAATEETVATADEVAATESVAATTESVAATEAPAEAEAEPQVEAEPQAEAPATEGTAEPNAAPEAEAATEVAPAAASDGETEAPKTTKAKAAKKPSTAKSTARVEETASPDAGSAS
jgi:small subunit ribosomal protein S1